MKAALEIGCSTASSFRLFQRICLIGEHCDYSKFPVLVCKDKKRYIDYRIAVNHKSSAFQITVHNLNSSLYSEKNFTSDHFFVSRSLFSWYNYIFGGFLAAVAYQSHVELKDVISVEGDRVGLNEKIESTLLNHLSNIHLDLLVDGQNSIPEAGLSSSSCLVCGGALAFLYAFSQQYTIENLHLDERLRLAELCAAAEALVIGTCGGSMDHITILAPEAEEDVTFVYLIEFHPNVRLKVVQTMPFSISIVDSGLKAQKSQSSRIAFNQRVLELKLASLLLADEARRPSPQQLCENLTLKEVLSEAQNDNEKEMADSLILAIPAEPLNRQQLISLLEETSMNKLEALYLLLDESNSFREAFEMTDLFHPRKRAQYVVEQESIIGAWLKNPTIKFLGECMNKTQTSLREQFRVSIPELDALCDDLLEEGCMGAKLCGAGFGGVVIGISDNNK